MLLRRTLLGAASAVLLVLFGAMLLDLVQRHHWPGWDEGWMLVAFPLGVPAAVAASLGRTATLARIALVSIAVWSWGAALFALWLALD